MSDPLVTYLHDHLGGAKFAVQLLETLADKQRAAEPLGVFAKEHSVEIERDRMTLQKHVDRLGGNTNVTRESSAWVAENASNLKLDDSWSGTFQSLEMIALGIQGKLALWGALMMLDEDDTRIKHLPLVELIERARVQHARVEECRCKCAPRALQADPTN